MPHGLSWQCTSGCICANASRDSLGSIELSCLLREFTMLHYRTPFLAVSLAVAALPLAAQDARWQAPVYKCGDSSYSQAPCGKLLNDQRVSRTYEPPPQDRARRMQRAQLPPETQKQCAELEQSIRSEEARLHAKPSPTQEELGALSIRRVNYREMRC